MCIENVCIEQLVMLMLDKDPSERPVRLNGATIRMAASLFSALYAWGKENLSLYKGQVTFVPSPEKDAKRGPPEVDHSSVSKRLRF